MRSNTNIHVRQQTMDIPQQKTACNQRHQTLETIGAYMAPNRQSLPTRVSKSRRPTLNPLQTAVQHGDTYKPSLPESENPAVTFAAENLTLCIAAQLCWTVRSTNRVRNQNCRHSNIALDSTPLCMATRCQMLPESAPASPQRCAGQRRNTVNLKPGQTDLRIQY